MRYERVCSECGHRPIDILDIDRLYESPTGERVIVSDTDLARLPAAEKSEIEVLQFIPANQLDPIHMDRTYNLEPGGATPRAYVLLAKVLERTDRIALVHFTLRAKTRLAALRSRGGVMVIQTLLWPDEIRRPLAIASRALVDLNKDELAAAVALVDTMTRDFDPDQHVDEYQVQLKGILDNAIAAQRSAAPELHASNRAERTGDPVVDDLVEALRRSVRDATHPQPDRPYSNRTNRTTGPTATPSPPSPQRSSRTITTQPTRLRLRSPHRQVADRDPAHQIRLRRIRRADAASGVAGLGAWLG